MNVTNITDYQGNCIKDYLNTCIILTTHQPILGCGSLYARIWRAGLTETAGDEKDQAAILLITEL